MLMIAIRPLHGDYGNVAPNQCFDCHPVTAERLMARGLARRYIQAPVFTQPETKVAAPPENKAAALPESKPVQPVIVVAPVTAEPPQPKRRRHWRQ